MPGAILATMQPGRVVRRYQFFLQASSLGYSDSRLTVDGEAEELCEPDEWGEPGRVVARHWIWARDQHGRDVMRRLASHRVESLHSAHAATWADFDQEY